jgi:hypothetical protein
MMAGIWVNGECMMVEKWIYVGWMMDERWMVY